MEMDKIFLTTGITELKNIELNIACEGFCNKPTGAFWGSSYIPKGRFKSDWQEWCYNNAFMLKQEGIIFKLKENAKILVIDSMEDYEDIVKKYGRRNKALDYLEGSTIPFLERPIIDFLEIAKEYDGIQLTKIGEMKNRYTLYGWDCESICLFNLNCIEQWEKVECKIQS